MNILIYAAKESEQSDRLISSLASAACLSQIKVCNSIEGFIRNLVYRETGRPTLVILVSNMGELFKILALRELLESYSIILILPGDDQDTVSAGHKLYPRYVAYSNSDFSDVVAVLSKMDKTSGNGICA